MGGWMGGLMGGWMGGWRGGWLDGRNKRALGRERESKNTMKL
jgi:hypothetical protein